MEPGGFYQYGLQSPNIQTQFHKQGIESLLDDDDID